MLAGKNKSDVHLEHWRNFVSDCREVVGAVKPWIATGRLTRVAGLVMESVGLKLAVGSSCIVELPGGQSIDAEVVGFSGDRLFLMPSTDVYGLTPGARVVPIETRELVTPQPRATMARKRRAEDRARQVNVGPALLGRVVDGAGRPLDG